MPSPRRVLAPTTSRSTSAWPRSPTSVYRNSPRSRRRARSRRPRSGWSTSRARARSSWGTCARSTRSSRWCDRRMRSRSSVSSCSSPTATTSSGGSSACASKRSPVTRSSGTRSSRSSDCSPTSSRAARSLTTKPVVTVVNGPGGIDLDLEEELAQLPDDEAAEFRDGGQSALDEIAGKLHDALDLVTFFTAGDKETRAWTLRNVETALDATETIHTDIARGFIRCEVINWRDLVDLGSRPEVMRRGLQRLEGKEYVIHDGDVLNIRFNI